MRQRITSYRLYSLAWQHEALPSHGYLSISSIHNRNYISKVEENAGVFNLQIWGKRGDNESFATQAYIINRQFTLLVLHQKVRQLDKF